MPIVAIFPAINPRVARRRSRLHTNSPRLRGSGYFSRLMYARISVTESLFTRGKIIISLGKVGAEFTTSWYVALDLREISLRVAPFLLADAISFLSSSSCSSCSLSSIHFVHAFLIRVRIYSSISLRLRHALLRSRILTMKHGCAEGRDREIISVRITLGVTHFPRDSIDSDRASLPSGPFEKRSRKVRKRRHRFLHWRKFRREAIEKWFSRIQNPLASPSPCTRYDARDLTLIRWNRDDFHFDVIQCDIRVTIRGRHEAPERLAIAAMVIIRPFYGESVTPWYNRPMHMIVRGSRYAGRSPLPVNHRRLSQLGRTIPRIPVETVATAVKALN